MARQIQFRRGTADEHKNFTGADGEITVDTTNKTIRVHDGTTPGGTMLARQSTLDAADYVVAWQTPTAENNYTWYRKYKSGWVEQGGCPSGASNTVCSITLPVEMSDANYTVIAIPQMKNSGTGGYSIGIDSKTTTNFRFRGPTAGTNATNVPNWQVSGMATI